MENDKFDYTYAALTEEERLEIEQMRREYSPEQNKLSALEKMRRLNRKVRRPAEITAVVMGVVGVLTFGAGLSIVMDAVQAEIRPGNSRHSRKTSQRGRSAQTRRIIFLKKPLRIALRYGIILLL